MIIEQDQLMLLVYQFYASVLQRDDAASVSAGRGGEDETLSLQVRKITINYPHVI